MDEKHAHQELHGGRDDDWTGTGIKGACSCKSGFKDKIVFTETLVMDHKGVHNILIFSMPAGLYRYQPVDLLPFMEWKIMSASITR